MRERFHCSSGGCKRREEKQRERGVGHGGSELPIVLRPVLDQMNHRRTIMVHNGDMKAANRAIRQSVSLPAGVASQVRSLAKTRRLSANRMIVELIENGIAAEKRKQQEFFELADRFRHTTDPKEVERLGDQMGRMVFGG